MKWDKKYNYIKWKETDFYHSTKIIPEVKILYPAYVFLFKMKYIFKKYFSGNIESRPTFYFQR